MPALLWLSTILGVAKEAAEVIEQFRGEGKPEPTVDELMQALTVRHGADSQWKQSLERLRKEA